uniref:Uncharacterized protein n=1 Tax=Amphimedon queenslandica TaxID=400682 RepID=A0A1X7TNZ3_AMPQE
LTQDVKAENLKCPTCNPNRHDPVFISLNANFLLCRKRKTAQTIRQNRPLSYGRFLDQSDVEKCIDIISPSATNN